MPAVCFYIEIHPMKCFGPFKGPPYSRQYKGQLTRSGIEYSIILLPPTPATQQQESGSPILDGTSTTSLAVAVHS